MVRLAPTFGASRVTDQFLEYLLVHVGKLLDVEAPFASRMLPELPELAEHLVGAFETNHSI